MPKLFVELFCGAFRGKRRTVNEDIAFGFVTPPAAGALRPSSPPAPEILGVIGAAGGMGGAGAGDMASTAARSFIESIFMKGGDAAFAAGHGIASDDYTKLLGKVFDECNRIILQAAASRHKSGMMGTTLAFGVIVYNAQENKTYLHVGNVGNCRGYIIRGEQIFHATEEDSVAWRLYKKGAITYSELLAHPLRSQITVMGIETSVSPEVHSIELRAGDMVIFCTDGVHEALEDPAIYAVTRKYPGAKKGCEHLLEAARSASGGRDNAAAAMACCAPVAIGAATGRAAGAQAPVRSRRSARRSKAMLVVWSIVGVLAVAAAAVYFQQPAAMRDVKDFFSRPAPLAVPQPAAVKKDAKESVVILPSTAVEPVAEKKSPALRTPPTTALTPARREAASRASGAGSMKVEWNAETERFRISTSGTDMVPTQIRYGSEVFDVVPVKSMPNLYRTTKPLSRAMISASKLVHITVADSKKSVAVVFTQSP